MPRVYLVVDQKDSLSISVRVCHTLCSLRGSVGVFFLRAPVSILPRLSLEVKEISAKVWRFGTLPHSKTLVRFGTMLNARTGEAPCIQRRHLGAVIASCHRGPIGEGPFKVK